jgi:hypothetical protein
MAEDEYIAAAWRASIYAKIRHINKLERELKAAKAALSKMNSQYELIINLIS